MNIAIIGATSFLGEALIQALNDSPHQLQLFSRNNVFENISLAHQWTCYSFPDQLLDYDSLLGFDTIYYCAGAGIQPKHQDNNQQIYELNAFEPIRLISALNDKKFEGKLVTFGSYFEIGNQMEERCYSETELATHSNALPNAYCKAKNLLSRYIHTELCQEAPLSFTLQHFVLTNIYGASENHHRLIPYIVQSSIQGEELSFTSGIQQRQYTHIRDISSFLIQTINSNKSGIFNLTDPQVISVKKMIETVLNVIKQELEISPQAVFGAINKRDNSMKYLGLNTAHLQNCFNFEPKISLEEGIKEYIIKYSPSK